MLATLRQRTSATILKPGTWENQVFEHLAANEPDKALAILSSKPKPSFPEGHYQPQIPYILTLESFDAMIQDDPARGAKVAAAVAGWAAMVEPALENLLSQPLNDDVWRVKVAGPTTGSWLGAQGIRDLLGQHLMGYAYDFSYNFMTDAQRTQTRRVIARATAGRLWLGARLPPHFRNWNWIMCGMSQPLLALAIEGEEGYDPRVYQLGVQIARDYLTYGISPAGSSTEAVGYTQFGFVWGGPFLVAATRRGDMLLPHSHHRAMLDWYLHSMEPAGAKWQSHGDGGDTGPSVHVMSMWRYFFPQDPKVRVLWHNFQLSTSSKPFEGRFHMIEPLIMTPTLADEQQPVPESATADLAALNLPNTFFDPDRGSLNTRSSWQPDAAALQFECRTDSHGASHEHADRGNFTFSALGRIWAKESFRSIETRHHNSILIDGAGQGYWPGPGVWLGMHDVGWAVSAAIDAKPAYDWMWPKQIVAEDPNSCPRFAYPRWATYRTEAEQFQAFAAGKTVERDTRPAVVAFWKGFEATDPRLWDEDSWPVRVSHNPVEKAFRTVVFIREPKPYLLVVDDVRKDSTERLYEWQIITGPNTDVAAITQDEILLADASHPRTESGLVRPPKASAQLLVRSLDLGEPQTYSSRPSMRLEAFEKRDTTSPAGRSFGLDRRLVIPSRSAEPKFKVLLFPLRTGETPPTTTWNEDRTSVTIQWQTTTDTFTFLQAPDGRTRISVTRPKVDKLPAID
jgi:hypothetical protein